MNADPRKYQHLRVLILQYGQDYFDDYDDERAAFDAYIDRRGRVSTEGALRELTELDASYPDEATLETALERAGLAVLMLEGETPYRDFVRQLQGWLREALKDVPAASPGAA